MISDLRVKELRATLLEKGLAEYLGTYKLSSGETIPAIAVLKSYDQQYPPAGTEVAGLEAVLMFPQIKPMAMLGGHDVQLTWYLFLKQWNFNESTAIAVQSLVSAINKLNYVNLENIFTNPSNQAKNQPETVRIELSTYRFIV